MATRTVKPAASSFNLTAIIQAARMEKTDKNFGKKYGPVGNVSASEAEKFARELEGQEPKAKNPTSTSLPTRPAATRPPAPAATRPPAPAATRPPAPAATRTLAPAATKPTASATKAAASTTKPTRGVVKGKQ